MPEPGEIYRHYKNHQCYQVIAVAKDTESLEDMVVYRALYESRDFPYCQVWCRPLKMWLEKIDGRPRFEKVAPGTI